MSSSSSQFNDSDLEDLRKELKKARKELETWSELVGKAVRGEETHQDKEEKYKEREKHWLELVRELSQSLDAKTEGKESENDERTTRS